MKEFSKAEKAYADKYRALRWPEGVQSDIKGEIINYEDRKELWEIAGNSGLHAKELRVVENCVYEQMEADRRSSVAQDADRMKPLLDARRKCLVQPRFSGHKSWNDLDDEEWLQILAVEPKFADLCDWKNIEISDISLLALTLATCPQCIDKINISKLDEYDTRELWLSILQLNPTLVDRCNLQSFSADDWGRILQKQPQLSRVCDWDKLRGCKNARVWENLLDSQPRFADKCPWDVVASDVSGSSWVKLLIAGADVAEYCDWSKLNGDDWVSLIAARPEFAKRCPWQELNGSNWVDVIIANSQCADRCVWTTLDGYDWVRLLKVCPQFVSKCAWDKLTDKNWIELLSHSLSFAQYADRRKAGQGWTGEQFLRIVDHQPGFINYFPTINTNPEQEDGRNWIAGILVAKPEAAMQNTVPWNKFNCRQWQSILLAHPEFVTKCNMDAMDDNFWFDMLMNHPDLMKREEFSKRFSWKKFVKDLGKGSGREHLAELLIKHPEYADKCDWKDAFELDDSGINDTKRGVNIFSSGAALQKEILTAHPYLAKYCCWAVVDATTWAMCYNWEELWAEHEKEIAAKKREAEEQERQANTRRKEEQEKADKAAAEKRAKEEKAKAEAEEEKRKAKEEADKKRAEEERKERSAERWGKFQSFVLSLLPSAIAGYGIYKLYMAGDLFHAIALGAPLVIAMIMYWCRAVHYTSLYLLYTVLVGVASGYGYQYHNWDYAAIVGCVGLGALIQNCIWHRHVFHSVALYLTALAAGGLYLYGRWGIGTAVVIGICFLIGLLKEMKNSWTWWRWALYVLATAGGIVACFCNHEFWGIAVIICAGGAVAEK